MSAELSKKVWKTKNTPNKDKLSPAKKFVLLSLAYYANEYGENVRPGVKRIADDTNFSEKQIRRILKSLREDGLIIETVSASFNAPAEYRIAVEELTIPPQGAESALSDDDETPRDKGGQYVRRGSGQYVQRGVDNMSTKGNIYIKNNITTPTLDRIPQRGAQSKANSVFQNMESPPQRESFPPPPETLEPDDKTITTAVFYMRIPQDKLEYLSARFIDYCWAKGARYQDYQAGFRNWLDNRRRWDYSNSAKITRERNNTNYANYQQRGRRLSAAERGVEACEIIERRHQAEEAAGDDYSGLFNF